MNTLQFRSPDSNNQLLTAAKTPNDIFKHAVQLSSKDKRQIVSAYSSNHYEIAMSYLWGKTVTALKKELSSIGVSLLGEMLGRTDVDDDDDVDDILTAKDAIRLAEELKIISPTDGLHLRHTYETINHFSNMDIEESDLEDIDEVEALGYMKACVKGVLGRPVIKVAQKFVDFRESLEEETLKNDDSRVTALTRSPYFFHKLTVNVLMNAAKNKVSANLEHVLANINTLVPLIWSGLRDSERWQIGHTYSEVFSGGKTTAIGGLQKALLKVRGFDFVPENLRSDTFIKAANSIIKAHEGMNNFYNEPVPVRKLGKLGTTIPIPAIPACITALLCVVLGNPYGKSWEASEEAHKILDNLSEDRLVHYLDNIIPGEPRILDKLHAEKPRDNWIKFINHHGVDYSQMKNKNMRLLMKCSTENNSDKVLKISKILRKDYYG